MNVSRYLIFDHENELVKLSYNKIEENNLIIFGKDISDIKKFNPKTVLCYQNDDVVDECKRLKQNCIHLYQWAKYHQNKHSNIANLVVSRFNLSKIENEDKNYRHNFTIIQEASDIIAKLMVNFLHGNNVLVNPGKVTTCEILDFYEIERESRDPVLGENKTSISSYEGILSPIKNYFQENKEALVNIYIPTYHRLEKTKKSLLSIIKDVKLSKYDVKIYIGDNSPNYPKIRDWLRELEDEQELVSVYFGERNIGKSGMVNHLYRNSRKCDYLFSIDSDMIALKDSNFVDTMIFHLTRLENCGLVSSNQAECSQHWFGKTVDEVCKNGLKVGYSSNGVGIAGGCICLRSEDWEGVGMYKENHDIYTGDDGILTHNIEKILGKYVYVAVECSLKHPYPSEDEKGYTEWKGESWKRDQLNFLNEDYKGQNKKGFYD